MKRYATLTEDQDIIQVFAGESAYNDALNSAKSNPYAAYVRPVIDDENEEDLVVDFGNCHAFAIK